MPNDYFQFKKFRIEQAQAGMKVTTDGCLFGAWVAHEIQDQTPAPARIVDVGAGTGVLSLMIAQVTKSAIIDAIEINTHAFDEASKNFHTSPWSTRIRCFNVPIQKFTNQSYDVLICNPPFFKNSQSGINRNKNEAVHEGSLTMEELVQQVPRLLSHSGKAYFLYPEREMDLFCALAKEYGLFLTKMITLRQTASSPCFRKMGCFGFASIDPITSELMLKENGKYTSDAWELLKGYYLEYNNPMRS